MRAILLAAGLGTRLRPLTNDRPKCMVPVAGTPILVRNIAWLRDQGVTDLIVNLHHHPGAVRGVLGDGSQLGVRIRYSEEPELLGTAGAVLRARSMIGEERFLVVYADNLAEADLVRMEQGHAASEAVMTIALFRREDVASSGVALVDEDGRIQQFVEKPSSIAPPSHLVNAGLYICEARTYAAIPAARPSDFGQDVIPRLLRDGAWITAYQLGATERLYWVDTPEDLIRTEEAYLARSDR